MAKTQKPTQPTACRVLVAMTVQGVQYAVDDLVQFDPDQTVSYADGGYVDPHPDAVAYCRDTLGKTLIVHVDPQAAEAAAAAAAAEADAAAAAAEAEAQAAQKAAEDAAQKAAAEAAAAAKQGQ